MTSTAMLSHYVKEFDLVAEQLPGQQTVSIAAIRKTALQQFQDTGFPHTKLEDWKYTRIPALEKTAFQASLKTCVGLDPDDFAALFIPGTYRLTFINGHYAPMLSSRKEETGQNRITNLAEVLSESADALKPLESCFPAAKSQGFDALNTAFLVDGAYVDLRGNTTWNKPLHLLFIATQQSEPLLIQPHNVVMVGENNAATLIETYANLGEAAHLTNALTAIMLEKGGRINHVKLQQESKKATHIAKLQVHQQESSHFNSYSASVGAHVARNDIHTVLAGRFCECKLYGLYCGTGRQLVDYHTRIDHAQPDCRSEQLYKGLLNGSSRGVFNGKVYVHPHAQHTSAKQANANLLLSANAEIDTKPQLEIFADDVKCSHGTTIGRLRDDEIFYLQSRGIAESEAKEMLIQAFANEVIDEFPNDAVRAKLQGLLTAI